MAAARCAGAAVAALGGEVGFVGGVDLLHGARPLGEVGLVEQPGQVGDGVSGVGEQPSAAAGVVGQQAVQIPHRLPVPSRER